MDTKVDGLTVFDGCLTTNLSVTNFNSSPFAQVKVVTANSPTKPGGSKRLVATKDFNIADEIFSVDTILLASHDGWGCVACNDRRCMGWCDPFRFYFMDMRQALSAVPQISTETEASQPLIRLILKYISMKRTTSPKLKEVLDSVFQLTNVRDDSQKKVDDILADKVIAVLPPNIKNLMKKTEISNLIGILRTNTVNVTQLRGIGLFPIVTMLDHSCRENTTFETIGTKLILTAISPIQNGQPITFNFTKPFQSKVQRQNYLKLNFHFDCKCERCGVDVKDELRAFICQKCKSTVKDEDYGIVTCKGDGSKANMWGCNKCQESPIDSVLEKMISTENSLSSQDPATIKVNDLFLEKILHPYHYIICRCLDIRVNLLLKIRPQSCEKFVSILLGSSLQYQVPHHPDRANYFDLLGQIKKLLADGKGCKEAFTEATNIREKTCSKTSPTLLLARQKSANPDKVEITLWHHTAANPS